jgi:hypothetical protein
MNLPLLALFLIIFPLISFAVDAIVFNAGASSLITLAGTWFTFWAVGVRLFWDGLSQLFRPQHIAKVVFGIKNSSANAVVREVGFGSLSLGTLGISSLIMSSWVVPAAVAGALYYVLTCVGDVMRGYRKDNEQLVLMSDLVVAAVLASFVASRLL